MKFLKNFKNTFVFDLLQEYALAAIVISGVGFLGLGAYVIFAPVAEQARRSVFENTKSYNDGMTQELQRYYLEYSKADGQGKATIAEVVRHQYASYPVGRLPNHLQSFVNSILSPNSF